MLYNFDSVERFAQDCPFLPGYHTEAEAWYGGIGFDDCRNRAMTGDDSLVPQAEALLEKLEAAIEVHAHETRPDVCGSRVSVPDYLAGSPTCMRRRVRCISDLSPITVYVSTTCSQNIGAETMLRRGVAILALLLKLERIRPVTLALIAETHGTTDGACVQVIRVESQPINLSTACFALTHVGFTRYLTYGMARKLEGFNGQWPAQFYRLSPSEYRTWVREHVWMQPQDLYIEAAKGNDPALINPVAWVNEQVRKTQEEN